MYIYNYIYMYILYIYMYIYNYIYMYIYIYEEHCFSGRNGQINRSLACRVFMMWVPNVK